MERSEISSSFEKLQGLYLKVFKKDSQKKKYTFGEKDIVNILSPGRVNIIGEHTDYNLGLSINTAINKYIFITGSKNKVDYVEVFSRHLNDSNKFSLNDIIFLQ